MWPSSPAMPPPIVHPAFQHDQVAYPRADEEDSVVPEAGRDSTLAAWA